mmetsp:Transcript_2335/g.9161  ORF Transcript_2335/g.9161 Transcript_2335/m.9161 type:complete len:314 (+) Transcript_2335:779-1720(+)
MIATGAAPGSPLPMCTPRLFRNALFDRGRCAWSAYARRSSGRPATTSMATVVVAPSFNATGALNAPLLTATPSTKTPEMLADAAVTFISMAATRCEGTSATYRRVTLENAGAKGTASPTEAPTEGRGSFPIAAGVTDATRSSMLTSDGSLMELAHRYSSHSPSTPVERTPPSNSATSRCSSDARNAAVSPNGDGNGVISRTIPVGSSASPARRCITPSYAPGPYSRSSTSYTRVEHHVGLYFPSSNSVSASPSPSSSAYASPAASKPSGRHAGSQFAANTSMRVTTSSRRNSSAIEVRTSSPLATKTPFTSIL